MFFLLLVTVALCAADKIHDPEEPSNVVLDQAISRANENQWTGLHDCLTPLQALHNHHHQILEINRCVCKFRREVAPDMPRAKGLEISCRRPSTIPVPNPYDRTLHMDIYCSTYGAHENWPVCALF